MSVWKKVEITQKIIKLIFHPLLTFLIKSLFKRKTLLKTNPIIRVLTSVTISFLVFFSLILFLGWILKQKIRFQKFGILSTRASLILFQ
jgi:hypothetical protein